MMNSGSLNFLVASRTIVLVICVGLGGGLFTVDASAQEPGGSTQVRAGAASVQANARLARLRSEAARYQKALDWAVGPGNQTASMVAKARQDLSAAVARLQAAVQDSIGAIRKAEAQKPTPAATPSMPTDDSLALQADSSGLLVQDSTSQAVDIDSSAVAPVAEAARTIEPSESLPVAEYPADTATAKSGTTTQYLLGGGIGLGYLLLVGVFVTWFGRRGFGPDLPSSPSGNTGASMGKGRGRIVVKDAVNSALSHIYSFFALVIAGLLALVVMVIAVAIPAFLFSGEPSDVLVALSIAAVLAAGALALSWWTSRLLKRLAYAKGAGTIVDLDERWIEFSGFREAGEASDLFSVKYYTQAARRQRFPLDDIISMTAHDTVQIKDGQPRAWYAIALAGSAGTVAIGFGTVVQRDQLFAVIRAELRMGTPVFES